MAMTEQEDALKQIVARYEVCFEVWPLRQAFGSRFGTVGFEVDLVGSADKGAPHESRRRGVVYSELRHLALAALPQDRSLVEIAILPFDESVHCSRARSYREDVEVHIHIQHNPRTAAPIDESERRCLLQIVDSFRALGVREGRWHLFSWP